MSSVLANLDASLPIGKAKSTDEKIKAIEDYLVQLLEQFRWTLNNLSADNFNEKEVVSWLNETITEPIQVAIQSAEEDMRTEIQASAEGVTLDIHREYAVEWFTGTAYKIGDVIKRESTNIDGTVNVGFYRCTVAHTASLDKKPPTGADWSSYWSVTQATDVLHTRFDVNASEIRSEVAKSGTDSLGAGQTLYSRITQNADAITQEVNASGTGNLSSGETLYSRISQTADDVRLEVKGGYADEWTSGSTYYTKDVVKVSTLTNGAVTAVNFYKCKYAGSHTASSSNKPGTTGGASYWDSIPDANIQSVIDLNLEGITLSYDNSQVGSGDHNASYIKLTKDGTEIAGGKVFIKDLDASTITTGTLNAENIHLLDKLDVQATGFDNQPHSCGEIGGSCTGNAINPVYSVWFGTPSAVRGAESSADFQGDTIELHSYKWDAINERADYTEFIITHDGITIRRRLNGSTKTYNLLDLLDQI